MSEEKVFAKNLSDILDFLDITQTDFAKRTGLTQAAISQLVNGEREPSLKTIKKVLEVIPCSFERLMYETQPQPAKESE